ncbi:MAG: hypothetical protein COV66_01805 [Nitrospinae bacterium CG11_big_fil_rev_8_21_14_0_20_45_15]|nr:MAG: hypothetical protein COV66_01805 [Nitrospinae bacterium CG11_big_fil_rev_8_21_14_0_20_45_15]
MCNVDLKCAIIQSGQKGYEIANQLGWSPSKISQIVIGVYRPSSEDKRKLSKILGRSIEELFPVPTSLEVA